MTFPIDFLRKSDIFAILSEIYSYKKKILKDIRNNYLYLPQALRQFQDMMNKLTKKKNSFSDVSKEVREYHKVEPEQLEKYFIKMEYSLSQFKYLLLSYLILENIGAPAKTMKKIRGMKDK